MSNNYFPWIRYAYLNIKFWSEEGLTEEEKKELRNLEKLKQKEKK